MSLNGESIKSELESSHREEEQIVEHDTKKMPERIDLNYQEQARRSINTAASQAALSTHQPLNALSASSIRSNTACALLLCHVGMACIRQAVFVNKHDEGKRKILELCTVTKDEKISAEVIHSNADTCALEFVIPKCH